MEQESTTAERVAPSYTLVNTTSEPDTLVAALRALERGGAIDKISLRLDTPDISFEEWEALGEAILQLRQASKWWIGDWYIFGGVRWGEDKAAAARTLIGVSSHQMQTIIRTCMLVHRSRRRLNLTFSHHSEVARLMPEEQDRWLRLCEQEGWSRDKLREEMRRSVTRAIFPENEEPKWEGAVIMRRQLDVEKVAREIWQQAVLADTHYLVGRELMGRLGEALGLKEATNDRVHDLQAEAG